MFDHQVEKKYLGNICTEKGCPEKFVVFYIFSARSHCSTHQILELSDQPFIFLQINPQLFELFDIENIWNNVLVVMNYLILFLGSKLKV